MSKTLIKFHTAVRAQDLEGMKSILSNRIKKKKCIDSTDENGQTALHSAASNGFMDMAQLLIDYGASVNAQDKSQWTPLLCAASNFHLQMCELLLGAGASANHQNSSGTTMLHFLTRLRPKENEGLYLRILKTAIEKGCNPNLVNGAGETPLHQCSLRGNLLAINFLLNSGADLNIRTK